MPPSDTLDPELAPTSPLVRGLDRPVDRVRRLRLVDEVVREGPVVDARVVDAMLRVPRQLFVPPELAELAYENRPLAIGWEQMISQPLIVAIMSEALELAPTHRVLEVGTGSGYQAAILSLLAREVFTIERVGALAEIAQARLARCGFGNVHIHVGDGYQGWAENAPYDRILVTAAPPRMPEALLDQLADGGVLVTPVGGFGDWDDQRLVRARKSGGRITLDDLGSVRFVPMLRGVERPGLSWS